MLGEVDYTPRILLNPLGPRLSALEIQEASEHAGTYDPDLPNKSNGYTISTRLKIQYSEEGRIQEAYDNWASHTISDPMSYMGTYADVSITFKRF